MRVSAIQTCVVGAGTPPRTGWRNWLFVKVHTDSGLYGVGECWPRVVQTAIDERHKIYAATQHHGLTDVVGSGAITGIEMALWDLKGNVLRTPV